jgi:hypothetical protein
MSTGHDDNHSSDFDAALWRLHAQAVERVPMRTLMQLRPQRTTSHPRAKARLFAWPLAATCAVVLVAGGLFLRHPTQTVPVETAPAVAVTDSEPDDVYATLDESPELYLWLASNDTTSLVME